MDLKKILSRHHSQRVTDADAGVIFQTYAENAAYTFDIVEANTKNDNLRLIAANNLLVNLASAIEIFCKNVILSNPNWNDRGLQSLLQQKITLGDAFDIFNKQKVTREFLIANNYSFSNLEGIETVFGTLTDSKFLNEVGNHKITYFKLNPEKEIEGSLMQNKPNWRKELNEFYEIRNKYIHEGIIKKLTNDSLLNLFETIFNFQYAMDDYLDDKYDTWTNKNSAMLIIES